MLLLLLFVCGVLGVILAWVGSFRVRIYCSRQPFSHPDPTAFGYPLVEGSLVIFATAS